MATTTVDQEPIVGEDKFCGGPVAAGIVIAQFTGVFTDANGYLTNVINGGANKYFGHSKKRVDNSNGANGDESADCHRSRQITVPRGSIVQADVMKKLYMSDNNTYTLTSTNNVLVGVIVQIEGDLMTFVQIVDG